MAAESPNSVASEVDVAKDVEVASLPIKDPGLTDSEITDSGFGQSLRQPLQHDLAIMDETANNPGDDNLSLEINGKSTLELAPSSNGSVEFEKEDNTDMIVAASPEAASESPAELSVDASPEALASESPAELSVDASPEALASESPAELSVDASPAALASESPAELSVDASPEALASESPAELSVDASPEALASESPAESAVDAAPAEKLLPQDRLRRSKDGRRTDVAGNDASVSAVAQSVAQSKLSEYRNRISSEFQANSLSATTVMGGD